MPESATTDLSTRRPAEELTPAWVVNPVGPLTGDIVVRGSKNAVTKHLVASMLGSAPSTVSNCPDIGDVDITHAHDTIGMATGRSTPGRSTRPGCR